MNVSLYDKKEILEDVIKLRIEIGRLSWITWEGPKHNHVHPYKREVVKDFMTQMRK